jgi:hypothetical protein
MKQYRFRALITFDPSAREDSAPGHLSGTRTCCLVQPRDHEYFPARISWDKEPPMRPGVRAVISAALADGEAEAFFAPGQRFTIWADAVIGQTIRADGMIGHGVISSPVSPPLARARGGVRVAGPARRPAPAGLRCGRPGTGAWAAGGRVVSIGVGRPGGGGRWRCPAALSRPVPRWG